METYADNTGLMWENAEAFQALVVFAEVRRSFWIVTELLFCATACLTGD